MIQKYIKNRKNIIFFCFGLALLMVSLWWSRFTFSSDRDNQPWMTVFVHGSFGSFLGFLNLPNVMKDHVPGTLYCNVIKELRNDDSFYATQPMLKRGLVRVEPTYSKELCGNKCYGAYPILKAFQDVLGIAYPEQKENYFYTFGWSGLISQSSRRFEAIRLYNALSEELEQFHKKGIYPKIRILAHSHGGGLCLNLAGINKVMQTTQWIKKKTYSHNKNEQESLEAIANLFKELPSKEFAKKKEGQKVFSYVPEYKNLKVSELILLGTPIQPETEPFFQVSFFEKIYSIYSEEDVAQRLDWISSKEMWANQRLSMTTTPTLSQAPLPKITQICLVFDKNRKTFHSEVPENEKPSSLQHIMSAFSGRQTQNPTHEELWFFTWNEDKGFLRPLPISVFMPLITKEIDCLENQSDVDVHCFSEGDMVKITITPHKKEVQPLREQSVSLSFFQTLQKNISPWKTDSQASPQASVKRMCNTLLKANSQS